MKTIRRWPVLWLTVVLACFASAADAQNAKAARKQVEGSMLVTGRVTITPEGTIGDWTIDRREDLPTAVLDVIDASAPGWRFEPILVDGKPAHGSARMSLRMAAERVDDERFRVSIRDGYFGREAVQMARRVDGAPEEFADSPPADQVSAAQMAAPRYPQQALEMGVTGVVYLVLRIGPSGEVLDVVAEQVNLRVVGPEREMVRMREMLARSAVTAARRWQFRPPTSGEMAKEPVWSVRVPVDYRIHGVGKPAAYGQWEVYVPGPRMPVPWRMESLEGFDIAPDTLIAGEVHQVGMGLKLLGPLDGG
ncbi:energy transducer TonB [Luteimonas sp. SDU82]|uniref:energy transducer TonB n=1 Tax=Luteimonas sp. SDU82 TaxID=3422592 RepID=UPI003EBCA67F